MVNNRSAKKNPAMIFLDWYHKDFYSRSPSVDPENTTETDLSRLRSGSFHSIGSSLTDE